MYFIPSPTLYMKIQVLVQNLTNFKQIPRAFLRTAMDKVCSAIFEATSHFPDQKITMKKSFWQVKCTCNLHPINGFSHKKRQTLKSQNYLLQHICNFSFSSSVIFILVFMLLIVLQNLILFHFYVNIFLICNLMLHSSVDFFYLYWEMPREDNKKWSS